jgi:nitroreductase
MEETAMNETLSTIAARYSCRDFSGAPLSQEQLEAIVSAALAAPSAVNRQPWHVIAITDKALIDDLDAEGMSLLAASDPSAYERMMSRGGRLFYNAPCMILVASDGSNYASMDCGILSQNVALAAHSLGLGSVICGMAAIPFAGPRADVWKQRAGFPQGYSFGIAILVGTANSGKAPHDLDENKVTYLA